MASGFFRRSETAAQALDSLFAVLESGQSIELVYRGGLDGGLATFFLQVRGKTRGATAKDAADNARRLKQNLDLVLSAQPGLRFDDGISKDRAADVRPAKWRGRLHPHGMLVSAQQALKGLPKEAPLPAVLISPNITAAASGLSVIDTVLASPQAVEIVVSIEPRRLDEQAIQQVIGILQAIDQGKAAYFTLPERRKISAEEREILVAGLKQHLQRWLIHPSGVELNCTVFSRERPSETLMAMLGKALFPNQPLALSIEPFVPGLSPSHLNGEEYGALDLRRGVNATGEFPNLFPRPEQLADAGAKRCYPRPSGELASAGLRLGVAGDREVYLGQADRGRHTYVIGATGSGKSTLLYNMIIQDIAHGHGVCLIDPHGDLYREVLDAIPAHRAKDVVLIDPCDFERAVGINFLECNSPYPQVQMNLIVNEMIKIFDRLYDLRLTGGPMFEQYMRNALLLVMDNDVPGTLMDVPRLFEDKAYRDYLKGICKNPLVVRFWSEQAERAGGEAALANMTPYITSKLNQFTHNALLRPIIGQRRTTIDFRQIMDHRQILLVNLSKGLLGELDIQMLGMILIGKLFFAAMGRIDVPEADRTPFHWYIDEFQNFTTDGVEHLLSESRKFGIRLTLANQNLAQLNRGYGRDNLLESVLGNVGNLLFFRVGPADAAKLETYTRADLDAQDLQYLPDFHAAARLLMRNAPQRPFVFRTLPTQERMVTVQAARLVRDTILENGRRYTRSSSEVEKEIIDRAQRSADEFARQDRIDAITEILRESSTNAECTIFSSGELRRMSKRELLAVSTNKVCFKKWSTYAELHKAGMANLTLGELTAYSREDLLGRNFEPVSVDDICMLLCEVGLALAEDSSSKIGTLESSTQDPQEKKDDKDDQEETSAEESTSIPISSVKSDDELRQEIIDEWVKDLEEIEREMSRDQE
ncbi:type IV secretion system DNA-binding domain-containing protein [Methylocaldum sp. 14B]|uniref:type IV secretory system conjugative DNA transfer family protein n=1 Tax=Methylocaldum sp. 14B TaxID=1912213 RepID=UPI00098BAF35|nr:type IV secretion system DNA-binding domain-containing protein [Methylocaldum sp. 14B]